MPVRDLPPTLLAGAALVGLQALGLVGVLVYLVVEAFAGTADSGQRVLVTVVLVALAAAGLAYTARGLAQVRRWARAPALVANLMVLAVAWGFYGGQRYVEALVLGLWGVAVVVALFAAPTNRALQG